MIDIHDRPLCQRSRSVNTSRFRRRAWLVQRKLGTARHCWPPGWTCPNSCRTTIPCRRKWARFGGLHFQSPPHAQGKLVRCARGALLDVAVDARPAAVLRVTGIGAAHELTEENGRQLWVPPGFNCTASSRLMPKYRVNYKCTTHYAPECDGAVLWSSLGN